jgi:hypothetical protein
LATSNKRQKSALLREIVPPRKNREFRRVSLSHNMRCQSKNRWSIQCLSVARRAERGLAMHDEAQISYTIVVPARAVCYSEFQTGASLSSAITTPRANDVRYHDCAAQLSRHVADTGTEQWRI